MPQYKEAKSESSNKRGSYKKLHHIEIEPVKGENGGHIVTHHYQSMDGNYRPPETHMFGKDEGPDMMDHLSKHLKVATKEEKATPEDSEMAASEPASETIAGAPLGDHGGNA